MGYRKKEKLYSGEQFANQGNAKYAPSFLEKVPTQVLNLFIFKQMRNPNCTVLTGLLYMFQLVSIGANKNIAV